MSVYAKDKPEWIKEALDSLINQTVSPSEIIIVVDGPVPDEISNLLKEYTLKTIMIENIFLPVNQGRGEALKQTLPMSRNELVALADADDINLSDRFEKLIECFNEDANLSIVGGQIEEVDEYSLKPISKRLVPLSDKDIKKYLKNRSPFNQMTVMFKKNDVIKAGGYQPMHLMEDYYLWVRMAREGLKMRNLSSVLVNARVGTQMYARRGGWKYFKSNKAVQDELLKFKIISVPRYLFNIAARFTAQVLMPNGLRAKLYASLLRK